MLSAKKQGQRTRARLIITATKLFARSGKEGTSVSDIALHSGVNKALVYYHFRDKDTLYEIVLRSQLKKMVDHLHRHLLFNAMVEKNSRNIIYVFFEFWRNNPSILKLLLHEINSGADFLVTILQGHYLKEYQLKIKSVISILEDTVFGGCESDEECMQHFISLVGILMIFFILEPLFNRLFSINEKNKEQFFEKRIDTIHQMYRNRAV